MYYCLFYLSFISLVILAIFLEDMIIGFLKSESKTHLTCYIFIYTLRLECIFVLLLLFNIFKDR